MCESTECQTDENIWYAFLVLESGKMADSTLNQ